MKKKLFGILYLGEFEVGIDSLITAAAINCLEKNSIHSKILMETASIFRDKGQRVKLDCI